MATKEEWKARAVELAALTVILSEHDEMTLDDMIALSELKACVLTVAKMLKEEQADPSDEDLHEMMRRAAEEVCDE